MPWTTKQSINDRNHQRKKSVNLNPVMRSDSMFSPLANDQAYNNISNIMSISHNSTERNSQINSPANPNKLAFPSEWSTSFQKIAIKAPLLTFDQVNNSMKGQLSSNFPHSNNKQVHANLKQKLKILLDECRNQIKHKHRHYLPGSVRSTAANEVVHNYDNNFTINSAADLGPGHGPAGYLSAAASALDHNNPINSNSSRVSDTYPNLIPAKSSFSSTTLSNIQFQDTETLIKNLDTVVVAYLLSIFYTEYTKIDQDPVNYSVTNFFTYLEDDILINEKSQTCLPILKDFFITLFQFYIKKIDQNDLNLSKNFDKFRLNNLESNMQILVIKFNSYYTHNRELADILIANLVCDFNFLVLSNSVINLFLDTFVALKQNTNGNTPENLKNSYSNRYQSVMLHYSNSYKKDTASRYHNNSISFDNKFRNSRDFDSDIDSIASLQYNLHNFTQIFTEGGWQKKEAGSSRQLVKIEIKNNLDLLYEEVEKFDCLDGKIKKIFYIKLPEHFEQRENRLRDFETYMLKFFKSSMQLSAFKILLLIESRKEAEFNDLKAKLNSSLSMESKPSNLSSGNSYNCNTTSSNPSRNPMMESAASFEQIRSVLNRQSMNYEKIKVKVDLGLDVDKLMLRLITKGIKEENILYQYIGCLIFKIKSSKPDFSSDDEDNLSDDELMMLQNRNNQRRNSSLANGSGLNINLAAPSKNNQTILEGINFLTEELVVKNMNNFYLFDTFLKGFTWIGSIQSEYEVILVQHILDKFLEDSFVKKRGIFNKTIQSDFEADNFDFKNRG